MRVRAKFKVTKVEAILSSKETGRDENGRAIYGPAELRTIVLSPVSGGSEENKRFWDASPSGEIRLGTVNPQAWEQFELGEEYYVDFTRAVPADEATSGAAGQRLVAVPKDG